MNVTGRVLVIGYGNPLRGDDGLGCRAAAAIAARWPDVSVLTPQQLTLELAEPISRARLVILIDADAGTAPGHIAYRSVAFDPAAAGTLHHHVSPEALVGAAHALYGQAPHVLLVTVGGQTFDVHEGLSPDVEATLPDLLATVAEWIGLPAVV